MYYRCILIFLLTSCVQLQAQPFFPSKKYVTGVFRNPVDIPISLVGNFGECRPNHFHSGIDIRTNSKENLPIYAIADGFVSRVKIESGGFGNAIYITHANGVTSLYAHLNSFYAEFDKYIREQQYKNKTWKMDASFLPHQFPVKQGKQIALSGNTGASQGPHLHLEIRDSKTDAPLNPLLFFTNLPDTKAPKFKQLAVYDGSKSIYNQKPTMYAVSNGKLKSDTIFINSNKAFLGIIGDDYMNSATGTLGIYEMRLFVNDKPFFAWQMDNISYDDTRYMNALADYKTKKNRGPWIQLCRQLPNDRLNVYKSFGKEKGLLLFEDSAIKKIRIEILDTRNNKSSMNFYIKSKQRNTDMPCANELLAGKRVKIKDEQISFDLSEFSLYDDICFTSKMSTSASPYSYLYQVQRGEVPLHDYINLSFKPKSPIPSTLKDKIAVIRYPFGSETNKKGKSAKLEKDMVVASVRDFGTYEIVIDQLAPLIKTALKSGDVITNKKALFFTIKDDITTIAKVEFLVDGEWLRVVQKGDMFYYEIDAHFPSGKHNLVVKASDENNNTSTFTLTLIK